MENNFDETTRKRSRDNFEPQLDVTKRIQIKECYAIEYKDLTQRSGWQNGQLTYYKSDQKVTLFGAKNIKLLDCFNTILSAPKSNDSEEEDKREDKECEESCEKQDKFDMNSILKKEPTLPEGTEITLENKFSVRICHNKFVRHEPYKPASQDPEKIAMRKRIRNFIDAQDDIFAGSGIFSMRKVEPGSSTRKPASQTIPPKPHQTVHSHLATVHSQQESSHT